MQKGSILEPENAKLGSKTPLLFEEWGFVLSGPKLITYRILPVYANVVANPPFSDKTWSTGITPSRDPFKRFAWGEPPAKQGDHPDIQELIKLLVAIVKTTKSGNKQ